MDVDLIRRVAEGVLRREYSLMLGAGASMGSMGGNQRPLPSGPELRDEIVKEFNVPVEGQPITLPRAYAAAKRTSPDRLDEFIRGWFTRCIPDWQIIIPEFDWHRIWTLNIDDIAESAYRRRGIQSETFDWTSRHRDRQSSGIQIVHLHGFATEEPHGSDLVFSIAEYATTMRDMRSWHTLFTDEFADRPFIILGASLTEEFDLQQALSASASESSRGFPSVIVLKTATALDREELTSLGLQVVESEARDFMQELQDQLKKHQENFRGTYGYLTPEASKFLQQFVDLRRYDPNESDETRNFYAGYEPHWRNILDDDDARLESTGSILAAIQGESGHTAVDQGVHVLSGRPGAGKSTGLLRIAREFVAEGRPVFLFRGDENLDVEAASEWLKRVPGTVLIVNNCADFADSIGQLAQTCNELNANLLLVGSERWNRRNMLEHRIDAQYLNLRNDYGRLTDRDIEALLRKLAERRRLGRITGLNRGQQLSYFTETASRRLFEGMANLEGGQGFRDRIRSDYRQIQEEGIRRLYGASCIAFEVGYPIPLGMASRVAGLSVAQLQLMLRSYQDTMIIESAGIRPPHRLTAALVVESALSPDDRFDAMQRLLFALAPHVDIQAITRGTRPYRLVRRLMDEETVMRLLGHLDGRKLYASMQAPYDWNGRYWEQRALFESGLGNHPEARSYAEHSLQLHRHPFAFNTLGTILGRIAVQTGDAETLSEAIENLESARDERRWEASEHPYVTFFSLMIRFGQAWGLPAIPPQLRNHFNEWFDLANRSKVFTNARVEQQLLRFQRDWLSLATLGGSSAAQQSGG